MSALHLSAWRSAVILAAAIRGEERRKAGIESEGGGGGWDEANG